MPRLTISGSLDPALDLWRALPDAACAQAHWWLDHHGRLPHDTDHERALVASAVLGRLGVRRWYAGGEMIVSWPWADDERTETDADRELWQMLSDCAVLWTMAHGERITA